MSRTRTFIGIDVGKPIRDRLISLQELLAGAGTEVKWVEPANLHLTLLFLGEVEDREIPSICKLVAESTQAVPAFTMSVEGAGCFPNQRRPRILWVGVKEGADAVTAVHDGVETALTGLGFRREERRYTPHITLGRVKSDRPTNTLAASLAKQVNWKAGEVLVKELQIMGSELTPKGPVYTVLGRAPFQPQP
jgi:2'-5' RNA ligase